jgi:glycerate kinase
MTRMLHTPTIVLAPDSFKGSLSAADACAALSVGLRRVFPHATLHACPMADGGEGTLAALLARGGTQHDLRVHGADGTLRTAAVGIFPEAHDENAPHDAITAVIETAEIVGITDTLGMAEPVEMRSSQGLGEALLALLDQGATRVLVALGGSSTNDAGAGLLAALGVRFYDAAQRLLAPHPAALAQLASVDVSGLDTRLAQVELVAMSDVNNPLCGPLGATAIFGPQKGVRPEQVAELDAVLGHCATLLEAALGRSAQLAPGAGAAGGLGFALQLLGAQSQRGADVVAQHLGLPELLRDADWLITGEGRSDAQSLHGKAPYVASVYAQQAQVPTTLLSGAIDAQALDALSQHFAGCFSLTAGPMTLQECVANAPALLADVAQQVALLWRAARAA